MSVVIGTLLISSIGLTALNIIGMIYDEEVNQRLKKFFAAIYSILVLILCIYTMRL